MVSLLPRCHQCYLKKLYLSIFYFCCQCHICIHLCICTIICLITFYISSQIPFGLVYRMRESPGRAILHNQITDKHKREQAEALEWFKYIRQNSKNSSHLFSNETHKSRFFDYLQLEKTTFNVSQKSQDKVYKLLDFPSHTSSKFSKTNNKDIVISILYPNEDIDHQQGKFYVGQVLHHLLENFHHRFLITLCELNNTHDHLLSAPVKLIRQLVPVFIVSNDTINSTLNLYEREKQAYLQCILANFQSFPSADYVILLQDDAEPVHRDFSTRLSALIDYHLKQQWSPTIRQQPAFLKLYHPRWLLSYSSPSVYIIVQLFATTFLLTFLLNLSCQILRRNNKDFNRICTNQVFCLNEQSSVNNKCNYFVLYFILIIFIHILLDHSNVSGRWRSLHPSLYAIYPAPSCCIPGVLFFRQTYLQVTDYLAKTTCRHGYPIDSAFDDLPKNISLQTLLVEPNLIRHIGVYSRLRQSYINPYLLD